MKGYYKIELEIAAAPRGVAQRLAGAGVGPWTPMRGNGRQYRDARHRSWFLWETPYGGSQVCSPRLIPKADDWMVLVVLGVVRDAVGDGFPRGKIEVETRDGTDGDFIALTRHVQELLR